MCFLTDTGKNTMSKQNRAMPKSAKHTRFLPKAEGKTNDFLIQNLVQISTTVKCFWCARVKFYYILVIINKK